MFNRSKKTIARLELDVSNLNARIKRLEKLDERRNIKESPPEILLIKEDDSNWFYQNPTFHFYDKNMDAISDGIFTLGLKPRKDKESNPEAEITGLGLTYEKNENGVFELVKEKR